MILNNVTGTRRNRAFTLIELLVIITTVAVLVGVLVPGMARSKKGSGGIKCISNLQQISLAFKMFDGDNDDRFPFHAVSGMGSSNRVDAWLHFQTLSNELATPHVLMCPKDVERFKNITSDFSTNKDGFANRGKRDLALSYFVGLNADETKPETVLVGDRCVARVRNAPAYSSKASGGAIVVDLNSRWTSESGEGWHNYGGTLAMSDGSVQMLDNGGLEKSLRASAAANGGTNNNWFLFPQ